LILNVVAALIFTTVVSTCPILAIPAVVNPDAVTVLENVAAPAESMVRRAILFVPSRTGPVPRLNMSKYDGFVVCVLEYIAIAPLATLTLLPQLTHVDADVPLLVLRKNAMSQSVLLDCDSVAIPLAFIAAIVLVPVTARVLENVPVVAPVNAPVIANAPGNVYAPAPNVPAVTRLAGTAPADRVPTDVSEDNVTLLASVVPVNVPAAAVNV